MPTQVRCPRGHRLGPDDFDDESALADPAARVACPYCGALCTMVADPLPATKRATDPEPAPAAEPRTEFPGYQILDVLGRGGMGVVYKARQIRTDRFVALKVPGHLDLETRVRFTTEAQAAARVSHPNIVQVYEVGEHQGRPFLALEYVPGGTLADRLTGTPLPPRAAAALAETVARAVGAAHAHGVVHRDLKPANILVSSEFRVSSFESGNSKLETRNSELKVTDFGLARRLDADTGQTQSGTILGTPDYMAPEQAAGDTKGVGPPADVWALGAVLYELLTGRPPFRGTGTLETLEQVRTLDPVSPRRLQPAVPRDLETICLKCLHKDPARRYPDAAELADDLKRFLDGLPVQARPVSSLERWVKRARRNPLATGLAAGLCLVLIAAAGYGVVYHLRLQAERDRVQEQRDRARANRNTTVRSIEEFLTTEVSDDDLALEPWAEEKRKELLKKALDFYDELLRGEPDDPELPWLAARGAVRVGDIHRLLGRPAEAVAAYRDAINRLAPLAEQPPPDSDPGRLIGYCHNFIGEVYRHQGDPAAATTAYHRALAVQEPLLAGRPGDPDYLQDVARSHYNLGLAARQAGRPREAIAELDEARQLLADVPAGNLTQRRHRARIALNRGAALWDGGELPDAERECRAAIALYDALIAETRGRPDFRYERAVARINLGLVRWSRGHPAEARAELTAARDVLDRLADEYRGTVQYRADLARSYNGLAAVAFGDRVAARAVFDALAVVAGQVQSADEAAALSGKAAATWAALLADREAPEYHGELGMALGNQGRALERLRPDEARGLLTRGVTELLLGLKANPGDRAFRDGLRAQTRALAGILVEAGDHAAARGLAGRIAAELPDRVAGTHRAVAMLATCVAATDRQQRPDAGPEIRQYEALAVELVKAVARADWSDLAADRDCAPLLARAAFAGAIGK